MAGSELLSNIVDRAALEAVVLEEVEGTRAMHGGDGGQGVDECADVVTPQLLGVENFASELTRRPSFTTVALERLAPDCKRASQPSSSLSLPTSPSGVTRYTSVVSGLHRFRISALRRKRSRPRSERR
jgi:hypothetical protein